MEKVKPQPKLSEIKDRLDKLESVVATKNELKSFRQENEEFFVAIKNDLDNTATKDDLVRLENKVDKLGEELESTIQEKFGKILTGQDKVIKMLTDHQSEGAANLLAHKRMDESLEGHGKRISVLEAKAGIAV